MLPPQKICYGRTRRRRAHHALTGVVTTLCPISGMPKLPHRVSRESGYVRPGLRISVPKLKIGIDRE
jgi:ribosomal protein L32